MASALARAGAMVAGGVQDERIVAVDFERWLQERTSRGCGFTARNTQDPPCVAGVGACARTAIKSV